MPLRGPFVRLLWWIGVLGAGVLAVVGGIGLGGPGVVAVGVAGMLAACVAVGVARDAPTHDRRSVLESAVQASAWTVVLLLVLAGVVALAGGLVALLAGAVGVTAWLLSRVTWSRKGAARSTRAPEAPSSPMGVEVLLLPVPPPEGAALSDPVVPASSPVSVLTTPALGREWIRTQAALGRRLTTADRASLVRRRQETLDELERRDPAGFARWLADGAAPGIDPAAYVHGRRVHGDPTAGTDAA